MELYELEPILKGDTSKPEINVTELNTAAALAALSTKMLDAMANIYQIHGNVVRLGQNLDLIVTSLNNSTRDFKGMIDELRMRVEDLEAIKVTELESSEE